jgi:hypothetical protein
MKRSRFKNWRWWVTVPVLLVILPIALLGALITLILEGMALGCEWSIDRSNDISTWMNYSILQPIIKWVSKGQDNE